MHSNFIQTRVGFQETRGSDPCVTWLALCVLGLICIQIIRAPIAESLWLDELLTTWIISPSSFQEIIDRTYTYQAQSPLYFLFLKYWTSWWGSSPLLLRLPSLIFCFGSIFWLALLGKELQIKEPLTVMALPFLSLDSVLKAAITARPYGMSLFFATLSTLLLVRFTHSKKALSLILYALSLIITFYLHYLFAGIVLIHLAWLWIARERLCKMDWSFIAIVLILCTATFIPGLLHLFEWSKRDLGIYLPTAPGILTFLKTVIPLKIAVLCFCCFIATWLFLPWPLKIELPKGTLFLSIFWVCIPPTLFYAWSVINGNSLLIDRYILWRAGGIALLIGSAISAIRRTGAKRLLVCLWILLLATFEMQRTWHIENWSAAATFIKEVYPKRPILFYSGLREAECQKCRNDKDFQRYLHSPLTVLTLQNEIKLLAEYPSNDDMVQQVLALKSSDKLIYVGLPRTRNLSFTSVQKRYSPLSNLLKKEFNLFLEAQHNFGRVVVLSYTKNDK
jgi:uncharacterized membrane protein